LVRRKHIGAVPFPFAAAARILVPVVCVNQDLSQINNSFNHSF